MSKVIVPVGRPLPGARVATVAVKVIWSGFDGLTEEATVVLVAAWLTVCFRAAVVLVVKLLSPEY